MAIIKGQRSIIITINNIMMIKEISMTNRRMTPIRGRLEIMGLRELTIMASCPSFSTRKGNQYMQLIGILIHLKVIKVLETTTKWRSRPTK